MKFSCFVDINAPIEKVIELFDNVDNLKEWQDGFQSYEHLEGEAGQPGAKSRLFYVQGKRRIELIETIIVKNLPEEFSGKYEHTHMENTMANRFSSPEPGITRYETEIEYTRFIGFMPKLMAFLFPSMFKKQVQKWLDQFKIFVEKS
ncbi:SRPBCC family protein [Leptobacterium flavescens]|uniref:SRPBCC family protein n=1 Tax=Leptobacterium flavescens TaxID=472055 RepID=A0A6P0UGT3_9FLAO|nr:SRPBCC family protein [Leptobacterium flavescens]NER12227.1 SRPBCC family protein [Leptobacterium flavescens]